MTVSKLSSQAHESIEVSNTLRDSGGNLIESVGDEIVIHTSSSLELNQTIKVTSPHLWSPSSPDLYVLCTEIRKNGEVIDHVNTPIGIRWFEFDADKGFFLNGVNMKIKGVCVHHDAGALGAAVPVAVWERRLQALQEMGCNAIRMSHNPPAPHLLDLCDRMGFLVIDEAFDEWEGVKHKWSTGHNVYPPKHFGYYEEFPQWGELDIKEMVLRDRNHPSIILWSIGNEVDYPNDPYCHPYFQTMTGNNDANKPAAEREYDPNKPQSDRLTTIATNLVRYVKECDMTRPVTAALAFPELANLIGYVDTLDVVGYNYKEHLYEEARQQYPNRVTIGSENSASLEAWLAVKDNDAICAQFIWTGIDYMGEAKGWPIRVSQAGFMDLAGYKKASYYFRQSLWLEDKMVFLAATSKDDPANVSNKRWHGGAPHWNWKAGEQLDVICYTNCEEAELFLNERSLGTKKLIDSPLGYLSWEVSFEEGTLNVVARSAEGIGCSYALETAAKSYQLLLQVDAPEMSADGQDIAHVEIEITDSYGKLVYLADDLIQLSIDGPGEIIGLENGDVQDLEPYSSKFRKAYHGKLLAYVRTGVTAGQIVVKAEAQGLITASIVIAVK
ncbi:glycoside hydrolase family 2 TIM barrel-domain containing protein [Paenibacillus sp. Soil766]|uniref:glycoside hydrolase family 2 TIM barrel-domain containing protein n=1 Tax=Paenibacillus sp. Soil766 TaxID=1736404 RepID=UPI0009EB453F|nr:glycoside hydrolase family 2 TIM barrel-domain containing protein [Paenibacillus sp. Soil766]